MICMKVKCQKDDMKTSQISEPDFEILPCLSLYPGGFLWIAWSRWSRMTFRWRSSENQVADWACLVPWFHFDHLSIQRTDATLILYTYYIHILYIFYTYYIHICVYIYTIIYRYTHISSVPFHMVNYLWDLVSLLLWPLRTWISFEVKNLTFQMMWQESWSWRWTSPGQNSLWSLVCQAFFYLAVQSVQVPDTELGFSVSQTLWRTKILRNTVALESAPLWTWYDSSGTAESSPSFVCILSPFFLAKEQSVLSAWNDRCRECHPSSLVAVRGCSSLSVSSTAAGGWTL
jgi:hypothetical protein